MHGLINRSFQSFIQETYGQEAWDSVIQTSGLEFSSFEAMLTYADELTDQVIEAGVSVLGRARETLMEDLGHFLVSDERVTSLRRLLRFAGANFTDFVNSLEELPERGRLALPNLDMPELELIDHRGGQFTLRCTAPLRGVGYILVGMLRAMADDYGALVLFENLPDDRDTEIIAIRIADQDFNEARPFNLGMAVT